MKRQIFWVAGIFLVIATVAANSHGAARWRPPKVTSVSIEGTIETIGPGGILAMGSKDHPQQWMIAPQRTTKILVTGTASIDFLKPHMLVQFKAQADEKGVVKDKVSEVTIVTAATASQSSSPPPTAHAKGKPEKEAAAPAAPAGESGGLLGAIVAVHGHKFSTKVGKKIMEIELAEDAKVNISVDIAAWAARGDKILVKGKSIQGRPGFCEADEVTITLAEPLTSGKKKPVASKAEANAAEKAAPTDKSADSGDDAKPKKKKKAKPTSADAAPAADSSK